MDTHPVSCISQIAWRSEEHHTALSKAAAWGVSGIEIAPSLLFADCAEPFRPPAAARTAAMEAFADHGLSTPSMQALLTGAPEAALFGDNTAREALDRRVQDCIALADAMGVPHLVFGSPKQRRVPEGMDMATAHTVAGETMARWNSWCLGTSVTIGLECNPPLYGGNFWTTHKDLLTFLHAHPLEHIGMTLDIGAATLDGVPPAQLANAMGARVRHIHWSAPQLAPPTVDRGTVDSLRLLRGPGKHISLEMARPDGGLDTLDTIFAALTSCIAHHG